MITPNPFTPESGWEPKELGGRKKQIEDFNDLIKTTIKNKRASHLIVLGKWGTGKTSLLKRFKIISQRQVYNIYYSGMQFFINKPLPLFPPELKNKKQRLNETTDTHRYF